MGDLPVDARRVVDELSRARRAAGVAAPATWTPSASFDSTLSESDRPPTQLSGHLLWMHHNWDLRAGLAPPPDHGLKGVAKRLVHRLVMATLGGYLASLQDYLGVNVRAVDVLAKRADELTTAQRRMLGAVRVDMVDLAHHLEERRDA